MSPAHAGPFHAVRKLSHGPLEDGHSSSVVPIETGKYSGWNVGVALSMFVSFEKCCWAGKGALERRT